jgi:membrane protease YdiL (CAAX protease family)
VDGPDGRRADPGSARAWPLLGSLALLAVVNLLNNLIAPGQYVLWAGLGVVGLAMLARADGLTGGEWGIGPVPPRAARAALALAGATAAVLLAGTQLPGVAEAYADERVTGMSAAQVAGAVLVRVPLGTALLEELAFRGVLLAMLARRHGTGRAVLGSSAAFAVWHLAPALGLAAGNAAVGSALGAHPAAATSVAVLAAGVAGAVLCGLRIRYDHVIVPWSVHVTANSGAYLLAWLMARA